MMVSVDRRFMGRADHSGDQAVCLEESVEQDQGDEYKEGRD